MVYRIVPKYVWECSGDVIPKAPIDEQDGYIHLSSAETVLETANLYFSKEQEPVVLCFDERDFGPALRWEAVASREGALFPHLYAPYLLCEQIRDVKALHVSSEGFSWGDSIFGV